MKISTIGWYDIPPPPERRGHSAYISERVIDLEFSKKFTANKELLCPIQEKNLSIYLDRKFFLHLNPLNGD
ncbi:MAG: hypothetical protein ACXAB4_11155 [Candidatus Hodarchaeales archaeon]